MLDKLSDDTLQTILSFCDIQTRKNFSCVSKKLNKISKRFFWECLSSFSYRKQSDHLNALCLESYQIAIAQKCDCSEELLNFVRGNYLGQPTIGIEQRAVALTTLIIFSSTKHIFSSELLVQKTQWEKELSFILTLLVSYDFTAVNGLICLISKAQNVNLDYVHLQRGDFLHKLFAKETVNNYLFDYPGLPRESNIGYMLAKALTPAYLEDIKKIDNYLEDLHHHSWRVRIKAAEILAALGSQLNDLQAEKAVRGLFYCLSQGSFPDVKEVFKAIDTLCPTIDAKYVNEVLACCVSLSLTFMDSERKWVTNLIINIWPYLLESQSEELLNKFLLKFKSKKSMSASIYIRGLSCVVVLDIISCLSLNQKKKVFINVIPLFDDEILDVRIKAVNLCVAIASVQEIEQINELAIKLKQMLQHCDSGYLMIEVIAAITSIMPKLEIKDVRSLLSDIIPMLDYNYEPEEESYYDTDAESNSKSESEADSNSEPESEADANSESEPKFRFGSDNGYVELHKVVSQAILIASRILKTEELIVPKTYMWLQRSIDNLSFAEPPLINQLTDIEKQDVIERKQDAIKITESFCKRHGNDLEKLRASKEEIEKHCTKSSFLLYSKEYSKNLMFNQPHKTFDEENDTLYDCSDFLSKSVSILQKHIKILTNNELCTKGEGELISNTKAL